MSDDSGPIIFKKKVKGDEKKGAVHFHDPTRKIAEEEFPTIPKVKASVSTAIMQARQASGLKRKELATKINEKEQVIHEYENGSAIPSQQVLIKMEKVLGVKLRGSEIGQKLPSKKPQN